MRKQGGGTIVNVSSAVALMVLPNNGPYASVNRALTIMSLTARDEMKKDNITVSVTYPYIRLQILRETPSEMFQCWRAS